MLFVVVEPGQRVYRDDSGNLNTGGWLGAPVALGNTFIAIYPVYEPGAKKACDLAINERTRVRYLGNAWKPRNAKERDGNLADIVRVE